MVRIWSFSLRELHIGMLNFRNCKFYCTTDFDTNRNIFTRIQCFIFCFLSFVIQASNPGQFESDVDVVWQKGQTQDSIYHGVSMFNQNRTSCSHSWLVSVDVTDTALYFTKLKALFRFWKPFVNNENCL